MPPAIDRFEVRTTSDAHFAWVRTRFGVEAMMMAWIRTAVTLIGFGFAIVQFFHHLNRMDGVAPAFRPEMPRYIGLAMIGTGIVSLAVSMWQYRQMLAYLWSKQFEPIAGVREKPVQTPTFAVAILVTVIGIFAFGSIFLRFL